MTFMARLRTARGSDSGVALMTVLMAGAVMTASALVAVNISLTNLKNSGRDRVAGGAMGAAEAGLAEAVNYLGTKSAGILACSPTCASNPWGNKTTPTSLTYPDGGTAKVWIEVIQAFNPPAVKVATYKIHSTGSAGNGPGQRVLEQTVTGQPMMIPIGVYATTITVNGNPATFKESVFSKNCITGRERWSSGRSRTPTSAFHRLLTRHSGSPRRTAPARPPRATTSTRPACATRPTRMTRTRRAARSPRRVPRRTTPPSSPRLTSTATVGASTTTSWRTCGHRHRRWASTGRARPGRRRTR